MNDYKNHSKPLLTELLSALKLDKVYIKAEEEYVYYNSNGNEKRILDLSGGYGSLLLGHNNPKLLDYMKTLYDKKIPFHTQMSVRSGSSQLSKKLHALLKEKSNKNYVSTILNSGTEAIEAAIKHAVLSFNYKNDDFNKKLEKELINIENYFWKQGEKFEVIVNNRTFTSFLSLKNYIYQNNHQTLNSNTPKILASKKSFHGKTTGSLSITSNELFRTPFLPSSPIDTIFFNWDGAEVKNHLDDNDFFLLLPKINTKGEITIRPIQFNRVIAIIIEPILGEGGVHAVPHSFLQFLRTMATLKNIALIFDEIQCGCYRTGTFLASFRAQVFADYYTIGKSLGGGVSKISALIIDKTKYIQEFDMLHSSTFAEDDFSSLIAVKSLEIMEQNSTVVEKKGNYIFEKLQNLKNTYEGVITDIRGDGLMIGISFKDFDLSQCTGFQSISRSTYFGYVLAGYLLNKNNIRVSVTLSDTKTIRIHPSLYISESSINDFMDALDELCYILQCQDFYALTSFVLPVEQQNLRPIKSFNTPNVVLDDVTNATGQVGFLVHFINSTSIKESIPSFDDLPDEVIAHIISLFLPFAHPVLLGRNCIRNTKEETIGISFMGLPFTSKMVKDDMCNSLQKLKPYQKLCNHAIDLLYDNGILKIGLGQYTSIIMQNGKAVTNAKVKITTGNGFTVFSTLNTVFTEMKKRKPPLNKVAIIGAGGNIATIMSSFLIDQTQSILLVGRTEKSKNKLINHATSLVKTVIVQILNENHTNSLLEKRFLRSNLLVKVKRDKSLLESDRLWKMYQEEFGEEAPVQISWDLNQLKGYDIIVVATNDPSPFLEPQYFKKGTCICDISVPLNCSETLLSDSHINVVRGGIVNLPKQEKLHPKGLPLKKGQAFACMVETVLMGLETEDKGFSFGELLKHQVLDIGALGYKHGFFQKEESKLSDTVHVTY